MHAEQHTVALSSGELAYTVAGAGAPVLYLHPDAGMRWNKVLGGLAASHRVYAPIAPGFDTRPRHARVQTIKDLAALHGEFIDTVIVPAAAANVNPDAGQARTCDLIGHSFGGWVAAWLALLRPDRIGQLVLGAASGFRPLDAASPITDPAARSRAMALYPHQAPGDADPVAVVAANREMFMAYSGRRLRDEELITRLGEIDRLTLILHGTADGIVPQASSQLLRARIRRSFLVYVWDAAHALATDQPERVLALTESFLERSESFVVNWASAAPTP